MFDDTNVGKVMTALVLVSLRGRLKNREADTCPRLWRNQYMCSTDKRKQWINCKKCRRKTECEHPWTQPSQFQKELKSQLNGKCSKWVFS